MVKFYQEQEGVHEEMLAVVGGVLHGVYHGVQYIQYLCDELSLLADD